MPTPINKQDQAVETQSLSSPKVAMPTITSADNLAISSGMYPQLAAVMRVEEEKVAARVKIEAEKRKITAEPAANRSRSASGSRLSFLFPSDIARISPNPAPEPTKQTLGR